MSTLPQTQFSNLNSLPDVAYPFRIRLTSEVRRDSHIGKIRRTTPGCAFFRNPQHNIILLIYLIFFCTPATGPLALTIVTFRADPANVATAQLLAKLCIPPAKNDGRRVAQCNMDA
jgi:hypothetical protein